MRLCEKLLRASCPASIASSPMERFPPEVEAAYARVRTFEALVGRHLDATLKPRGFIQSLQARGFGPTLQDGPAVDLEDGSMRPASALYEAMPVEYVRRYPTLAEDIEVEHVPCIDLWLHLQKDGRIRCELEGRTLEEVLTMGGHDHELDAYKQAQAGEVPQLQAIARALRVLLDAAAEK